MSENNPLDIIRRFRNGDQKACFDLLAAGIESGWLKQLVSAPADRLPPAIPARIAQYWHSAELPDDVRRNVDSMKTCNPDCAHELVNDDAARAYVHAGYGREGAQIFDLCFHPTMRSDLWRMCYLYDKGGIYVDVDTVARAPLSRIAAGADFDCLLTYAIGKPWCINNGFVMVAPRHPLILTIIRSMFANITRYGQTGLFKNIWAETGPGITTMATAHWLAGKCLDEGIDPVRSGLVFRPYTAMGEAFHETDMAYKASPAGNWRMVKAPPPPRL